MVVDDKNENKQIEAGIGTFFYKKTPLTDIHRFEEDQFSQNYKFHNLDQFKINLLL